MLTTYGDLILLHIYWYVIMNADIFNLLKFLYLLLKLIKLVFFCSSYGQRRSLACIQVGHGSKVARLDWLRRFLQWVAMSGLQRWRLNQSTCLASFLEKKECIEWYTRPLKILINIRWLCFLLLFVSFIRIHQELLCAKFRLCMRFIHVIIKQRINAIQDV